MAQEKKPVQERFGMRLAALRKAAGYTQAAFGAELGVSQRMIAYYESPEANPPATMLAAMATVLDLHYSKRRANFLIVCEVKKILSHPLQNLNGVFVNMANF